MNRINRYITKFDRYGAKVQLNYNGKETYENPIGGCVSLFMATLIIALSCKVLVGLVITGEPTQL